MSDAITRLAIKGALLNKVVFPDLPEGREYLCIGPNCWGRDKVADKAIKIAKSNFSSSRGVWKYLLYDVPAGAWVDEMGFNVEWHLPKDGTVPDPIREVARYTPKAKK